MATETVADCTCDSGSAYCRRATGRPTNRRLSGPTGTTRFEIHLRPGHLGHFVAPLDAVVLGRCRPRKWWSRSRDVAGVEVPGGRVPSRAWVLWASAEDGAPALMRAAAACTSTALLDCRRFNTARGPSKASS